jgi:imidazolonepropionase-like amidohydrolase
MLVRAAGLLFALLLLASAAGAQDTAFVGGIVYPSPDADPIRNAVIVIRDGRIAAVGPRESTPLPSGARIVDCAKTFITAGFWNSHVHIFTPGLLHAGTDSVAALDAELDAMLNRWGFTTVFDISSVLDNTLRLRRRVEAGEVRGPRILTVGEPLWTMTPIYVRDFLEAHHIAMPVVHSPADAVAQVRDRWRRGADGIKIFTGSVQQNGVANMPVAIVRAAVQEAHRHRLPVFAHPQNLAGLEAAIAGGVDILAHTAPNAPDWTPSFVSRLTRARMALIPTLTLFDFEARKGGATDQWREGWLDRMVGQLRAFSTGGGQVLFGTDVGYTDHYDTTMELELMAKAGLDFGKILASLTTSPAARFNAAAHSGRIQTGYDADLVVLDADPARDVRNFARVRYTVRGGRTIYSER